MSRERELQEIAEISKSICRDYSTDKCNECGVYGYCMVRIDAEMLYTAGYRKADELIAENEKLRERHASLDRQIRAEARREFAEKLKNYYIKNAGSLKGSINCDLVAYHIEQILADMERKEEQ